MDFNDSFTERVAQKSRARKELLNQKKGEILPVGKKRGVLIDEHQVSSDEPPSKSPKHSSTLTCQVTSGKENVKIQEDDTNVFVPIHTASNSRGLSALKKKISSDGDDNISFKPSPEHLLNENKTYMFSTNTKELCSGKKSRIADLAANIRQWEDEVAKPSYSSKSVSSINATNVPSQNTFSMKLIYTERQSDSKDISNKDLASASVHTDNKKSALIHNKIDRVDLKNSPKKLLDWNAAVAATLETSSSIVPGGKKENTKNGGLSKECLTSNVLKQSCSDESMDENDFAENYHSMSNHRGDFKKELDYSPFKNIEEDEKKMKPPKIEALKRTAEMDPVELPIAARRALFEKNLLTGTPKINDDVCFSLSIAQRAAMFENAAKMNYHKKSNGPVVSKCDKSIESCTVQTVKKVDSAIVNVAVSPVKKCLPHHTSASSPTKRVGNHVFSVQQKLAQRSANNLQDTEFAMEDNQEISSMDFHSEESSSSMEDDSSQIDNLESSSAEKNNSEEYPLEKFSSGVDNNISEIGNLEKLSEIDHLESLSAEKNNSEEYHLEKFSSGVDNNISEIGNLEKLSSSNMENNCLEMGHNEKLPSLSVENNYSEIGHLEKVSSSMENNSEMHYSEKISSSSMVNACSEISHSKKSSSSSTENYSSVNDCSKKLSSSSVENSSFEDSSYGRQSCTSDSSAGSYYTTSALGEEGLENKKEKNSETPLLYTVSFYRKQKQETRLTPVQTIRRGKEQNTPESPDVKYTEIIQERIKCLQDEILRQQTVISQTSQALNLCSATLEFSGSTEQVEGERLLLISTQKRQACLNEITRLKTFGAQGESIADDRGTMTISDIILPLKREFVASQLEGKDNDTVHYFLCLIRHGAQVIVTQMMSTDDRTTDGTLVFTNHIQLQDLPPTFSVIFEVYALQTKKEVLPHEKKYHIKRESSKIRLTPKGKKNNEKMLLPAISSPGGPNAVRSPCFGVVGFTRFTLQNCNKSTFTLDKVPFTSPLEGVLRVKLQLHAEHKVMEKGFLTLFDDVGGFGAWLRRWCVLDANNLALWKYPDDEHKKEPAAIINLKQCITGLVKPVARNVCARPHTFQLVTMRPQEKGDQTTLVSRSVNTLTTTKHLLSADTKEERIVWCEKLNEALNNVRKWDPQALRPVEGIQV